MPFYSLKELTDALISPDHSTAHGPTITGEQLEVGYYSEPTRAAIFGTKSVNGSLW